MPLTATPRPSASGRGTDRPSFFLTTATTANQTLAAGEAGFLTTTGSLNSASNAIQLTGNGASLTNAGIVNATNLAVSIEPGLTGANVTNTGILASSAAGAVVASGLGATGIRVTNAGQILGGGTTTGGLSINGQLLLSISGLISAGGFAVTVSGTGTLASRIVNTGLIEALNGTAIQLNALGSDTVINTGTITGNILLGAGFDVYDGRGGTTDGIVFGGTGNDSYFVGDQAYGISELADASGGLDSVRSQSDYVLSNGIERLFLIGQAIAGTGSSDANTLTGNARDNLLDGASGNDTLFGLAGNDVLLGGFGNDSLEGGSLNDILDGREDDDTLDGQPTATSCRETRATMS